MKRNKFLGLVLAAAMLIQAAPMSVSAETGVEKIYVNANASTEGSGSIRSPYKTLAAAEPAVIEALKTSHVQLLLFDGEYYDSNVNFTADEIGGNKYSLTIAPKDGENGKVTISGGIKVEGFQLHDPDKNIYKASCTENIRQLYVDGTPAVRARGTASQLGLVIQGTDGKATGVTTTNTDVVGWDLRRAELVFKQKFNSGRLKVTGATLNGNVATFNLYENETGTIGIERIDANYSLLKNDSGVLQLENAYELLDEPGEWYSSGSYIYYKPLDGEDITKVKVEAPANKRPLSFTGATGRVISDVTISDITFSHGTWLYPTTNGGIIDAQSNVIMSEEEEIPGLVNTEYVNNFKIERCTFTNSGGSGLDILEGSKNVTVTGCEVSNIASAGILVGSVKVDDRFGTVATEVIENITIEQSNIYNCAIDYRSATGIAVGFVKDVNIVHNEIHDLPYSGVHIGWGWNYAESSMIEGIKVNYNYIHDCMKEMDDGALVYTLGPTNLEAGIAGYRNEIAYNYLQDVRGSNARYVYHDNGSSYWSTHHNVFNYDDAETSLPWANVADDTTNISVVDNFTNISKETTTGRNNDAMLDEMIAQTVKYEMNESNEPVLSNYLLRTADAVIKNAGVKTPSLYSFDDMRDTMTTNKVEFVGDDAIIRDGGSITFGADLVNKALNYNVYAEGNSSAYYQIVVDNTYKIKVYSDKVEYYVNDTFDASVPSAAWESGDTYDALLSLTSTKLVFASPLYAKLSRNATISSGRVVLSVHGMDMAIGDLSKHYTVYQELLGSYGTIEPTVNAVSNGYFEKDATGWTPSSATAVYSTDYGYAGTLGSLKVTETSTSGYAYTSATLKAGKWYRVSAKVRMPDSYSAGSAYAEFYSSDISSEVQTWGADNYLQSGWNHIKDYIKVDSNTTVNLGIKVTGSSSSTKYTYYIDNFEVVEEMPSVTEGGFEMGRGYWTARCTTELTEGYTGNGVSMDNISTYNYYFLYRPVHLVEGKTYRARAKIKLVSTKSGATTERVTFAAHDDTSTVDYLLQYGFESKEVKVGDWNDFEFTVTWRSETPGAIGYLKVISYNQSKIIIDDVELLEVKPYKTATSNANFEDRMTGWEYSGIDALTHTTGEGVKVEPSSASAKIYQEINALTDTPYYAECFVKLDTPVPNGYAQAKVNIDLVDTAVSATSNDFTVASGVATSDNVVLSSEQWSKVGGIITFASDDNKKSMVNVRLSASVLSDTNAAVDYRIMGFRLVPVSEYKTTLTNASINADGTIEYTATGESGSRIRYRYYTYNSGWEPIGSGYANMGATLNIGKGDVMAVLTTTAANGADEVTLVVEKASVKVLNASLSGDKITVNAVANNPTNKDFIIAVYDGKLMKHVMFATSDAINESITITDTFEEDYAIVKAFIWDMVLLRPLCSDKSFSVKVN